MSRELETKKEKNLSNKILSEITIFSKYAKYIPEENRRESWNEIVTRYINMLIGKYPNLKEEILTNSYYILDKKVLPSMRALQFAGVPIDRNPSRVYNCAYLPIDDYRAFSEAMFLLLGGTGVGYSVQFAHIDKLPEIVKPTKTKRYLVGDSIEGWSDAIRALVKCYLGYTNIKPLFDLSDIRKKGSRLITAGGKAPGPEPLKTCLFQIETVLERKSNGEKLTDIECHDMLCYIANAVLAGGIRRAAMISLFSFDSEAMLSSKTGDWYKLNEQRGRANNSAVIVRNRITREDWDRVWKIIESSNAGEPGVYFTNDANWGTNPCCFTGDMKLLTPEDYKSFKELAQEGSYSLVNKDGTIVGGKIWSNGEKDTITLNLHGEKIVVCTPDHRLMDNKGNEILAQDSKGVRLMPYFTINQKISEFTKYGFIQGDASTGRLSSIRHKGLEIYFGEKDQDVAEIFNSKVGRQYINGYNDILKDLGFSSEELPNRTLPTKWSSFSKIDKLDFLKGLYSANGCVVTTSRVAFKTTCIKLANQLVDILRTNSGYKIKPYITTNKAKEVKFSNGNYTCKESYDINIGRLEDIKWFSENIGFIQSYKQEALRNLIISRGPLVRTIGNIRKKEVYDFSLDDNTHWGVVEGIIAHNCEIALRPFQFCNLTEVNVSDVESQEDLNNRVRVAAFFGTLQAGFTDFHYLRDIWRKTTEKEALIGVGMTGIGSSQVLEYNLKEASKNVKEENDKVARVIKINSAARTTTIKPSGTSSCVLGTSSGIHAWHDTYYLRSIRIGKNESLYTYLSIYCPDLLEDDFFRPTTQAIIRIPQAAPMDSILRTESALDLLERVKKFNIEWVKQGHNKGINTNNVSATISIKPEEWIEVGDWMWNNKEIFNGLSVLNYDNGSYIQAPFEPISKEEFTRRMETLKNIDLTKVIELDDTTQHTQEAACAGGNCSTDF